MTLVTSAAVEPTVPGRRSREGARAQPPHATAIPRAAAQFRPAQRRRRRHQRQVDGHRHDRLDPSRLPSPADGDERRGDEEFRDALGARSPARWSAIPSCSSARSTRATDRSRSTARRSRCSPTSASTTRRWRSCAACSPPSCCVRARRCVNLDDPETRAIADVIPPDNRLGYGFDSPGADFMGKDLQLRAEGGELRARGRGRARRGAAAGARAPQCVERARRDRGGARARRAGRRTRRRRSAASTGLRRRLETVGERGRRHGDRRFRAQSRQDRGDAGDTSRASRAGC